MQATNHVSTIVELSFAQWPAIRGPPEFRRREVLDHLEVIENHISKNFGGTFPCRGRVRGWLPEDNTGHVHKVPKDRHVQQAERR